MVTNLLDGVRTVIWKVEQNFSSLTKMISRSLSASSSLDIICSSPTLSSQTITCTLSLCRTISHMQNGSRLISTTQPSLISTQSHPFPSPHVVCRWFMCEKVDVDFDCQS